ncbi:hypothetical protein ES703_70828 [subsurface metagenome]
MPGMESVDQKAVSGNPPPPGSAPDAAVCGHVENELSNLQAKPGHHHQDGIAKPEPGLVDRVETPRPSQDHARLKESEEASRRWPPHPSSSKKEDRKQNQDQCLGTLRCLAGGS